jgi:hypothetical protein
MRETSLIFGACGGLLGIGILFIQINFARADFNITNRYFGDVLFSKIVFPFFPNFFKNHQTLFIAIQKYSAGHTSTHQSRKPALGCVSSAKKSSKLFYPESPDTL